MGYTSRNKRNLIVTARTNFLLWEKVLSLRFDMDFGQSITQTQWLIPKKAGVKILLEETAEAQEISTCLMS